MDSIDPTTERTTMPLTSTALMSVDTRLQLQDFYARQVRFLDSLDVEGFASTFTDDGVLVHESGAALSGREEMLADMRSKLPNYSDVETKHWFSQFLYEQLEDSVSADYYAALTITDRAGKVTLKGDFAVTDHLVSVDGAFKIRRRQITGSKSHQGVARHVA
jgi:actinorhodin biosynthesis protein ActVIA